MSISSRALKLFIFICLFLYLKSVSAIAARKKYEQQDFNSVTNGSALIESFNFLFQDKNQSSELYEFYYDFLLPKLIIQDRKQSVRDVFRNNFLSNYQPFIDDVRNKLTSFYVKLETLYTEGKKPDSYLAGMWLLDVYKFVVSLVYSDNLNYTIDGPEEALSIKSRLMSLVVGDLLQRSPEERSYFLAAINDLMFLEAIQEFSTIPESEFAFEVIDAIATLHIAAEQIENYVKLYKTN